VLKHPFLLRKPLFSPLNYGDDAVFGFSISDCGFQIKNASENKLFYCAHDRTRQLRRGSSSQLCSRRHAGKRNYELLCYDVMSADVGGG